jgi:transposase
MSMTSRKGEMEVEVLSGNGRHRRWTAAEKIQMVRETLEPGVSVSLVARRHSINPNQLFHWRKLYQNGSLASVEAGEPVVPASELISALKRVRELERLLGRKVLENEILKEAVEAARERKWIARSPWLPRDEK